MDKNEFKEKYNAASTVVSFPERIDIEMKSIDPNPIHIGNGTRNLIIVMEEISELIEQLENAKTGEFDMLSLIEEVADTEQSLDYVQLICDITYDDIMQNAHICDEQSLNKIVALTKLQQLLSKYLRGKSNKTQLIEAIVYVKTALKEIKFEYNIGQGQINKAINVKLQRLQQYQNDNKLYT